MIITFLIFFYNCNINDISFKLEIEYLTFRFEIISNGFQLDIKWKPLFIINNKYLDGNDT